MIGWGAERKQLAQIVTDLTYRVESLERASKKHTEEYAQLWMGFHRLAQTMGYGLEWVDAGYLIRKKESVGD